MRRPSRIQPSPACRVKPVPVGLPRPERWAGLDDVARHAGRCLGAAGLDKWSFGWDRAVKRLGCCHMKRQRVTLSRYFAECCLAAAPERILDTLLHEIAHALAWESARESGHGPVWKAWCAALGAVPRATVADCPDFSPRAPRYRLQNRETGEVYREYARRPRFRRPLQSLFMRGRPDTLGKLVLVEVAHGRNAEARHAG